MLEVFYQLPSGLFAANAEYLSVSQPISGVNWWNKRDAYGRPLDQSDLLYRKVEKIADIDGDKITDLVVRYTKSSGVFDRSNDYEIYLGSNDEGKLDFGREPSSIIRAEGTLTDLQFIDLDNDNRLEVLVSGFDIGVSQVIGALLSGSIDQDVYLFKMDQQSRFKDKANLTKQVQLNFSLTSGQSGKPVVTLGDLNGDGYDELILSNDDNELKVFFGQFGNIPFSKSNQTLTMTLPKEGSMVSLGDINLDGKDDILLQYGRQDDKALQRQIKVLLSQ
ncbi:FG-GAP repeat domain-containing protein [Shewanella aestuarii]|uniref:VCBS repeat-containing protein n=1 Tax=Shewanella aestuarii TaxID=1028752 RepID=A0A6G9QLX4_9GAMM|nr:VCBS repeat-containing protein [Shewanella aestuarii]QIR15388.1 VCBS repeat-containing protein [Shewanella aestuarii]